MKLHRPNNRPPVPTVLRRTRTLPTRTTAPEQLTTSPTKGSTGEREGERVCMCVWVLGLKHGKLDPRPPDSAVTD